VRTATRGDAPRPNSRAGQPALCSPLRSRVVGRVATPDATELSGLSLSRTQPGVLWTHNDSGDSARVFAVAADGLLRAELAVPNAAHIDWEEIAVGRAPSGDGDALYIGDIGDNLAARPQITVYVVPEPRLRNRPAQTAPAAPIALKYPSGAHDAEALLVDPSSGALVIVTKSFGGVALVYSSGPRAAAGTLQRVGSLSLGAGDAVTAGSVSADGRTIVLRSYGGAVAWARQAGESLPDALRRAPCVVGAALGAEGQGEALAVDRNGRAFYTVPEGKRPAIRRYEPPDS